MVALTCFAPALLHFLVSEISPVYLTYGGSRSFIIKMALSNERIRLTEKLGFDVITAQDQVTDEQLNGMTYDARKACIQEGVQGAIWSVNPRFSYSKDGKECFSPSKLWGVANILGLFHMSLLAVNLVFLFYWSATILNLRIWSWADPRYFVFTWKLEDTIEYKFLAYFNLGCAVVLSVYAFGTFYYTSGWDGVFDFLRLTWAELAAMFHAAMLLLKAWTPPYNWEDEVFLHCQFTRSLMKFHQHNDDFGRKLSDSLLRMASGSKGELEKMLANTQLWPHILYSNQDIAEGRCQAIQALIPKGDGGSSPRSFHLTPAQFPAHQPQYFPSPPGAQAPQGHLVQTSLTPLSAHSW